MGTKISYKQIFFCAHWVRTSLVPCTVLYKVQVQCTTCSAQYLCSIGQKQQRRKKKRQSKKKSEIFMTPPHLIQYQLSDLQRHLFTLPCTLTHTSHSPSKVLTPRHKN